MTDKTELQNKIIEQANTWYQLGCDHFGITPRPLTIKFEKRGRVAGTACCSTNELDFNMDLAIKNEDDFLKQTVPHEVCHLIARQKFGKIKPHGKEWGYVMNIFGLEAKRCHNYNVSSLNTEYRYVCDCGKEFYLTNNIHSKITNGQKRWHCRGRSLTYQGKM